MDKTLYVVHCVDAEGPLCESISATFERLNEILGLDLPPSRDTLAQIQRGELDLGDKTATAQRILDPALLAYNEDWGQLDVMLAEILSPSYRARYADSTGGAWVYSWFVLDHVGYDVNPRRRDIGYHNIFDHYRTSLADTQSERDEIAWHFHPMSTYREAHVCATSFLRSPHLLETIARRVIERKWFPSTFRAGFHSERPDSHWFLEQWIPFDFSNQALPPSKLDGMQQDLADGRFGDWRRAPNDWSPYHPAHDDYQRPGNCNRWIFRCLNVGTRLRLLNEQEAIRAFERADRGLPTILAFCNHDFRDMRNDVDLTHAMLRRVALRFPNVQWRSLGAKAAAQRVVGAETTDQMTLSIEHERIGEAVRIRVRASKDTFGPQPFLAVKTLDNQFLTDNFDFQVPRREWTYTFDRQTIRPRSVEAVGVAANCAAGTCNVVVFDLANGERSEQRYR
jgi:hypothetical protein